MLVLLASGLFVSPLPAAERALLGEMKLRPFLEKYCYECHGIEDEASDLNLKTFGESTGKWLEHQRVLGDVLWVVEAGEMPPASFRTQPDDAERIAAVEALQSMVDQIASTQKNDPGRVVMPRMTKAEYDRVIRDLTGLELNAARFLPNDSLAGEGFANVGEAQGTTMGEIERFLGAAGLVMQHLHASPETGLNWFARPLDPAKSREKLVERQIRLIGDWYANEQQRYVGDHVDSLKDSFDYPHIPYLEAAYVYRHRKALHRNEETLADLARNWSPPLRPEILENWWNLLNRDSSQISRQLRAGVAAWLSLPGPQNAGKTEIRHQIDEIMDQWEHLHRYYSLSYRPGEKGKIPDLRDQMREGRHPFYIELASGEAESAEKPEYLYLLATDGLEANEGDVIIWQNGRFLLENGKEQPLDEATTLERVDASGNVIEEVIWRSHPEALELPGQTFAVRTPAMIRIPVPADAKVFQIEAAYDERVDGDQSVQTIILKQPLEHEEFLRFYPGTHVWAPKDNPSTGAVYDHYYDARNMLIARGFKIQPGKNLERSLIASQIPIKPEYLGGPWDDQELLEVKPRDTYRIDLHYLESIAAPARRDQLRRMLTDLQVMAQPHRQELEALVRQQGQRLAPDQTRLDDLTVAQWPDNIRERYWQLVVSLEAEQNQMRQAARAMIQDWVSRAWRRELTEKELFSFQEMFEREWERGARFDEAVKIPLMAALVSPHFLYRYQESQGVDEPYALTDWELANRLSFFLWGSLPDAELRELADRGELTDPGLLLAQAERMLADPRIDYLAVEFAGRWLQFAGFEDFTGPDTDRFPSFTPELREAMYQEARQFFLDLFQQDRPITRILEADETFANDVLAEHYGLDALQGSEMRRVSTAGTVRGGVIGMGAVLTRYSEPLRTSPVRRGHWIYENLMGYPMPEPPPNVPMISQDDVNAEGQSVREELVKHREDPSCASCHNKIDPLGIALENLDPIGAWRETDSADQPVQSHDTTHDGVELAGVEDLRTYLLEHREAFIRNFCEKLLGFALGRAVVLSDLPLIEEMESALANDDYRFSAALKPVLTSPQFLQRRDERPVSKPLATQ